MDEHPGFHLQKAPFDPEELKEKNLSDSSLRQKSCGRPAVIFDPDIVFQNSKQN
jgi:hypothetical protein